MVKVQYDHFIAFNELMDLGSDHQWLQVCKKERARHCVPLMEVPLKEAS